MCKQFNSKFKQIISLRFFAVYIGIQNNFRMTNDIEQSVLRQNLINEFNEIHSENDLFIQ